MQYVYLIESDTFHKIGIANDPQGRLAQLQTGNPCRLEMVSCYGFDDAGIVERALHQAFSKLRERNEWFRLTTLDKEKFDDICFMLGGLFAGAQETTIDEVTSADDAQATMAKGARWDYRQMFSDGWRIEPKNKRYWQWRERNSGRASIYGGCISDLPYPVEEMKERFS